MPAPAHAGPRLGTIGGGGGAIRTSSRRPNTRARLYVFAATRRSRRVQPREVGPESASSSATTRGWFGTPTPHWTDAPDARGSIDSRRRARCACGRWAWLKLTPKFVVSLGWAWLATVSVSSTLTAPPPSSVLGVVPERVSSVMPAALCCRLTNSVWLRFVRPHGGGPPKGTSAPPTVPPSRTTAPVEPRCGSRRTSTCALRRRATSVLAARATTSSRDRAREPPRRCVFLGEVPARAPATSPFCATRWVAARVGHDEETAVHSRARHQGLVSVRPTPTAREKRQRLDFVAPDLAAEVTRLCPRCYHLGTATCRELSDPTQRVRSAR